MFDRPQLLHQLANRFLAVGDRSQTANRTVGFGDRDRNGLGMDIQPQKSYRLLHDRILSACGSELCSLRLTA
jgi:hypothetical protein